MLVSPPHPSPPSISGPLPVTQSITRASIYCVPPRCQSPSLLSPDHSSPPMNPVQQGLESPHENLARTSAASPRHVPCSPVRVRPTLCGSVPRALKISQSGHWGSWQCVRLSPWGVKVVPVSSLPLPWSLPDWLHDLQRRGSVEGHVACSALCPRSLPSLPGTGCEGPQKNSHCPTLGSIRSPDLDRKQLAESREKRVIVPMMVGCRKATTGLQGLGVGANFFKSTPKTSDTEIP